ncbi:MAG: MarC family protein, partial [Granulosicoccaceae bacterium]
MITAFVTLFVIVDPIGLVPIFLALTAEASPDHRRKMAIQGCAIGFAILLLFALL